MRELNLDIIITETVKKMIENSIDEQKLDVCRDYDDLHDIAVIGANFEDYLQNDDEYKKFCKKLKLINIDELNNAVEEAFEWGFNRFMDTYKLEGEKTNEF